jgi:hypothetical protein
LNFLVETFGVTKEQDLDKLNLKNIYNIPANGEPAVTLEGIDLPKEFLVAYEGPYISAYPTESLKFWDALFNDEDTSYKNIASKQTKAPNLVYREVVFFLIGLDGKKITSRSLIGAYLDVKVEITYKPKKSGGEQTLYVSGAESNSFFKDFLHVDLIKEFSDKGHNLDGKLLASNEKQESGKRFYYVSFGSQTKKLTIEYTLDVGLDTIYESDDFYKEYFKAMFEMFLSEEIFFSVKNKLGDLITGYREVKTPRVSKHEEGRRDYNY